MIQFFWIWFEKNKNLAIAATAMLFAWQIFHLYWLTAHVVSVKLLGRSYFEVTDLWQTVLAVADYLEIPALVSGSLLYLNELRKNFSVKPLWFLLFLNSQWLHLFWITDEFILAQFTENIIILPIWLLWLAIIIDYFELPVIFDTIKKLVKIRL